MTETKKNTFDTTLTVADMCQVSRRHPQGGDALRADGKSGRGGRTARAVSGIHCRRRRKNPAHHAGMTQATDKPQAA